MNVLLFYRNVEFTEVLFRWKTATAQTRALEARIETENFLYFLFSISLKSSPNGTIAEAMVKRYFTVLVKKDTVRVSSDVV